VEALRNATGLGEITSAKAQRLLIVRAIDDEASLLLALGTIANYVTTRAIEYLLWIGTISSIPLAFILLYFLQISIPDSARYVEAVSAVFTALILILLGLLSVARTAHGRELAVSPMECQINTQSTPDAVGLSKIVTLVSRTHVKSLRHGIYGLEDCPKAISAWVHSQLRALPVR
ncbi:MAG: hypothetical protein WBW27_24210, partial [Pseudolabrys sp.]